METATTRYKRIRLTVLTKWILVRVNLKNSRWQSEKWKWLNNITICLVLPSIGSVSRKCLRRQFMWHLTRSNFAIVQITFAWTEVRFGYWGAAPWETQWAWEGSKLQLSSKNLTNSSTPGFNKFLSELLGFKFRCSTGLIRHGSDDGCNSEVFWGPFENDFESSRDHTGEISNLFCFYLKPEQSAFTSSWRVITSWRNQTIRIQ